MDASVLDKYPYIVYFIANRLSLIEEICVYASMLFIFIFGIKFYNIKNEYQILQQEKMKNLSKLGERELILQKLVKEWVETIKSAEEVKSTIVDKLNELESRLPDKNNDNCSCTMRKICENIKVSEETLESCNHRLDYLADEIDDRLIEQPLLTREIDEIGSQVSNMERWISLYFWIIVFFTVLLVIMFILPNTSTALKLITYDMVDKSLPLEEIEQATYDLKMLITKLY